MALLNHLVDLEYLAVAAYTAGLPLLRRPAAGAAKQFLAQELGHAQGLGLLVREAGGKDNKPRDSYELGNPRSETDVLRLLHTVETLQIAAYVAAIPRLGPAKVRTLTDPVLRQRCPAHLGRSLAAGPGAASGTVRDRPRVGLRTCAESP